MKNINDFVKMKKNNDPIVMLTAYDYISAKFCEDNGVDMILVGDSLGMVVYGEKSTLGVTVDDIIRHCKAVRNGAPETFIIADMPYMSYHLDINTTKQNAARMILEGKADCVKLEGGSDSRIEAIKAIIDCEIPVIGHLGLTPQSIVKFGGFKVQGKMQKQKDEILKQALAVEKAGAFMLVLECIPEELGLSISKELHIPTVGIGAGRYTDGQVLVWHDMLGLSTQNTKFSKVWDNASIAISSSVKGFVSDIKSKQFPEIDHVYYPIEERK
ncbi:MAG TPA: 3-methyl-2-oxobutanoate hydroxymethyltransferase [Candidatus Cloacimonadota bacterium]|nr:3-methyl-2-oxobutanoate hydroxymethyltransferase [Candidatus Cloacimonadota bacterium]HQB40287.1 3-methyl-2-oxobutanoate hydroxymethyltransferase [Candidatus Cloacimonadota bacterium]